MESPVRDAFFLFDSGGPLAWSPYGQWQVQLDSGGTLGLRHLQREGHADYGPFALPPLQARRLWELIDALDIRHLASSTRPPVPDEGAYTLRLQVGQEIAQTQIWRGDALHDPR